MNIADVMDELGVALDTVAGLRVFPYSAAKVTPPAAMVVWPDPLDYDSTMARGMDRMTLPVVVLVGMLDARSSRDTLAQYLDGSGSHSIKAAVEAGAYAACDTVRVMSATVQAYTVAATTYLGVEFSVDVIGQGA
jgi:hypothetical protein